MYSSSILFNTCMIGCKAPEKNVNGNLIIINVIGNSGQYVRLSSENHLLFIPLFNHLYILKINTQAMIQQLFQKLSFFVRYVYLDTVTGIVKWLEKARKYLVVSSTDCLLSCKENAGILM